MKYDFSFFRFHIDNTELQCISKIAGYRDCFITHAVKYWKVFEEGRVIFGKPLLWIPLSFSTAGHLGVRARDFPGKLFRVNRKGKAPLLMNEQGPQYFGKERVRIPRKWHLRDIVKRIARNMRQYYREASRRG